MDVAFTLEEAEEICEDFEDLKDTEFLYEGDMVLVDDVVTVPANDSIQPQKTAAENGYDVVIIASGTPPGNIQYRISIREYVALKGVSYNFPS
jgi:hypothetical protein